MNENTTVSRCSAAICRFNSEGQCTAGQIEITMSAQQAECLTFAPRSDAQGSQPSANR